MSNMSRIGKVITRPFKEGLGLIFPLLNNVRARKAQASPDTAAAAPLSKEAVILAKLKRITHAVRKKLIDSSAKLSPERAEKLVKVLETTARLGNKILGKHGVDDQKVKDLFKDIEAARRMLAERLAGKA